MILSLLEMEINTASHTMAKELNYHSSSLLEQDVLRVSGLSGLDH